MTLPQIAEKPMSQVEKIARLMGLQNLAYRRGSDAWYYTDADGSREEFNPLTNKSDLMDVECALIIDVIWCEVEGIVQVSSQGLTHGEWYSKHSEKLTARAHAVCAVAEQIYDRKHNAQNTD